MLKKIRKTIVMLRECVTMSLENIWGNKVRSFLTVLGILIGVTAVIALITTVSGVSGSLSSSFSSMGAGTLTVSVTGSDLKEGLTKEDLMNTFQTRVAIESFCAISLQRALDTPRGAAAVAVLRQQVLLQEQYAKENRFDEFLQSDILFHQTIIRFSENEDFQELYELHSYRIEEPARKCLREGDRCKETSGEHAAILRAIEHGDISHCYEAILRHNESTLNHSLQMLSQQDIL